MRNLEELSRNQSISLLTSIVPYHLDRLRVVRVMCGKGELLTGRGPPENKKNKENEKYEFKFTN